MLHDIDPKLEKDPEFIHTHTHRHTRIYIIQLVGNPYRCTYIYTHEPKTKREQYKPNLSLIYPEHNQIVRLYISLAITRLH